MHQNTSNFAYKKSTLTLFNLDVRTPSKANISMLGLPLLVSLHFFFASLGILSRQIMNGLEHGTKLKNYRVKYINEFICNG